MILRICSKCGIENPLNENFFNRNQSTNTGGDKYWRPECRDCTKLANGGKNKAVKNYIKLNNLKSIKHFKSSRPPVGEPCDNCGRKDKRLVFDHCHETLLPRGWLCDMCNRSIGMLGDNIEGLERALSYLKKAKKQSITYRNKLKDML